MNIYLANKMAGIPEFNFPWFAAAAVSLRSIPIVSWVFNPAEEDLKNGFDATGLSGSEEEAVALGFNRRKTLGLDWSWIAANSHACVIGPDWARSMGTKSEIACHQALGLPVWEFRDFIHNWNSAELDRLVLPELITLGSIMTT